MSKRRGFTLIELMVAVAIIAVLIAVGMVTYAGAQKKARTTKRIADMEAVRTALEQYYADNGRYPFVAGSSRIWRSECLSWGGISSPRNVIPGTTLVPMYMQEFPSDPKMDKANSKSCYLYTSDATGTDYKFLVHEVSEYSYQDYLNHRKYVDPARDKGGDSSLVDGTEPWSWAIYSSVDSAGW